MACTTEELARLRFQCRRGMGELEELLYPFFEQHFSQLDLTQQSCFAELLSQEDNTLWDWLILNKTSIPEHLQPIVKSVIQHGTA